MLQKLPMAYDGPVVLLLENIRSLWNVGSLFRTADAFGVQSLALVGLTGTPPHRGIHCSALGAELTVPWQHFATPLEALATFPSLIPVALEQTPDSIPLASFMPPPDGLILCLGNEVEGVSSTLLQACQHAVEIPQWGQKQSLNVSVAAGLALGYWRVGAKGR